MILFLTFLLLLNPVLSKLISTNDAKNEMKNSLNLCIIKTLEKYCNFGESIVMALSYRDDLDVWNSTALDKIILETLNQKSEWSIVILKPNSNTVEESDYIPINLHNYIIQIRNKNEIDAHIDFLKNISLNSQSRFLIICSKFVENITDFTSHIFKKMWSIKAVNTVIIAPEKENTTEMSVYTWFPYTENNCGNIFINGDLINKCNYGEFSSSNNLFEDKIPRNLNGCPLTVRTVIWPPYVIAPRNLTGELLHLDNGLEILMLNTIAKHANLSVIYSISTIHEDWGFVLEDGNASGILKAVRDAEVDIAISALAATVVRYKILDYSHVYTSESLTWCVPHSKMTPLWEGIFIMLHYSTWVAILITFIITTICTWSLAYRHKEESTSYRIISRCFINIFSVLMSFSVNDKPRTDFVRSLYLLWTIFALHIQAVYQTSLISFLTKPIYQKQITTTNDIFNARLNILFELSTKKYFSGNDSISQKITKEGTICNDTFDCLTDIAYYNNATMPVQRVFFEYVESYFMDEHNQPLLYVFEEDAVAYPIQFFMYKGFPLQHRLNTLVVQTISSGLMNKWSNDLKNSVKFNSGKMYNSKNQSLTMYQMQGAFFLLAAGIILSIITFIIELFIYSKQQQNINIIFQ